MTILYICNEYPPGKIGGIGTMTRLLARNMVNEGHSVLVAGLYMPGYGGADFETDEGVQVWRKRLSVDIGVFRNNYSALDTILLKSLSASGILQKDLLRNINRFNQFINTLVSRFSVDIIEWPDFNDWFRHLDTPIHWPGLNIPLVIKFNGTESFLNYPPGLDVTSHQYELEKSHISRASALVAVSRHTAENYERLYKLHQPVALLYNSIELPDIIYDAERSEPRIVFTGALSERKGLLSLIRAWNIVNEKHPEAILEIFGKGKISTFLREASSKARRAIRYHGFVTKEDFYKSMALASAAVFPSYTECFAFAPLEAMAIGCPVINTERCSGPELIEHEVNGLLINPDNISQIANAIIHVLEDKLLRKKFSQNGRKTIKENFNITKSISDHIQFYESVIAHHYQKAVIV